MSFKNFVNLIYLAMVYTAYNIMPFLFSFLGAFIVAAGYRLPRSNMIPDPDHGLPFKVEASVCFEFVITDSVVEPKTEGIQETGHCSIIPN